MPIREPLTQIAKSGHNPAETLSSGREWRPIVIQYQIDLKALRSKLKDLTPDNSQLIQEATRRPAPDSWIDSSDNPFEPE